MRRARLSALLPAPLLASCTLLLPFPLPEAESTEAGTCRDGVDNDFDGETDWEDPDCVLDESEAPMCADGRDNDGDGRTDYEDPGCWGYARLVVDRCHRVSGVDIDPFEQPGDFWTGAGTLVDRGDGFELQPGASGERALLLIPRITGAARSLRVVLEITLTDEAFDSPGEAILTVVRARDIGSDVRPDLSPTLRMEITTWNGSNGLVGFNNRNPGPGGATFVGDPETGEARLTLFLTDAGVPRLRIETATQWAEGSAGVVPWSPIDSLRLIWSPPAGVRVRSLVVHTEPADTCARPPELLAPPRSQPRALAHGRGTACLVLGDPTSLTQAITELARSGNEGATWEPASTDPEVTELESCSGIAWDEALAVFRIACVPPRGGGLVLGESPDCTSWRRIGSRDGMEIDGVSRALGYTILGEQHELWWRSQDGATGQDSLLRRWTDDPALSSALVEDEPEVLLLEDGTPLVPDGVRASITRVGGDRLFVRSDGVSVSLVVATAVRGEPANVRTVIDPLLSPSGIDGTFDSGLLSSASGTLVPPQGEEAARLHVVYTGSTHCAEVGVCGQHAGSARVSILPP